jgi:hypothetical protein
MRAEERSGSLFAAPYTAWRGFSTSPAAPPRKILLGRFVDLKDPAQSSSIPPSGEVAGPWLETRPVPARPLEIPAGVPSDLLRPRPTFAAPSAR